LKKRLPTQRERLARAEVDVVNAELVKLRAFWAHKQGLDGRLLGKSASFVLEETGWARSVGGAGPYLGLFARARLGRGVVDQGVAALEICELPSARGCTYVLPKSEFALGLLAGQAFGGGEMRTAEKLGVTAKEIGKLEAAVKKALLKGPLDPDEIRSAVGAAARSLGEEGKKKGLTTTLPVALGRLQAQGEIRRVPTNGRIDQQRYRYTLWSPSPVAGAELSSEQLNTELARRYFRWTGPATLAEFQWFSGLGVKASKEAALPLSLVPVRDGDARLLLPEDLERYRSFAVPKKPTYALVSAIDGVSLLRRDLKSLLDEGDAKKKVHGDKALIQVGSLADLPSHAILDRGRLVGLWEYDPQSESIAWMSFVPKDAALKKAVAEMEEFVRADLGDARSFSLDSPKSRAPRIAALRAAS